MKKSKISAKGGSASGGKNQKIKNKMQNRPPLLLAHGLALAAIFGASLWAFLRFEELPLMQLYVVITAILAYIAWGAIYHFLNKRLTIALLLEYILVGALVLLLFSWTLFT